MAVSAITGLITAGAGALAAGGVAAMTFFGLSGMAAFGAMFALGAGIGVLTKAMMPKPDLGAQLRGTTTTVRDPAGSRKVVYGEVRVGGGVVFISHSGTDNEFLHLAIVFATHEIESYEELWFNDKRIWTATNGFSSDWGDYVTIDRKLGTATQAASSQLIAAHSQWTSDHKLSGIAYVAFKLKWDRDHFPQGVPNITARIKGKKIYDPRLDTTEGGSGSHRADDSSTWEYSANPALCVRDYLTDKKYGLGEDYSTVNIAALKAAANNCDTTGDYSTATQKRFECHGRLDTNNQIKSNIEQLLASMGGKITYSGGEYFIDAAHYKTPSVTIDDSVVISAIKVQTKQSRSSGYNSVKGTFLSKEKNYKVLDYPAQTLKTVAGSFVTGTTYQILTVGNTDFTAIGAASNTVGLQFTATGAGTGTGTASSSVVDDGELIYLDVPLPFVTSNVQAQRLAKISLLKSRQQTVIQMTVNLAGLKIKVGDVINVTNTKLGYSSKKFEVIGYQLSAKPDGMMGVQLECIETASSIYDFTSADEEDFLSGGELDLYDGRTVDNVTSLTMTEIGLRGPDGGVKSAVELSWTAPDDAFIEYYTVRYNKNGTTDYFEVQTRETNVLLEGLDVTSNYDFQVKAQNLIGVRSSGTSLTNQALNGDTTAPSAPTSGAATGGIQTITAEWSNPTDIDFKHVEVFVNTTDSIPATPTAVVDGEEYIVTGLSGKETRYFWLKSVDFSGNKSAATASFSATAVKALSGDIDDDAVGSNQIADGAVGTNQIATGAITTTTIADDAITTPKIATNAVTANEIAANTITASEIAANTITASEIATDTITASEIAAGAIDTTELAADAVTTAKIAANAVTANEIAANTITASQIATDTITASEIAAGAIDTTELAADAVTTAKIAANAVTATEINVTSLDDISADAGTITGGSVGGISITSTKLYAGTGDWANTNTGFYVDNTGKFSLKDKFFYNPSNNLLTVDGNITADVITAKENLIVLGDLEASSMAAGSITRAMFSQDALDEIYGALATSVGGSNGDYKEASGSFTTSGGTVTVGTSSDKFDHGTADVVVEFLANHYFYTTTNYTTAQAQATLNFEVSADGTFTDLTSATKTQTLQFGEYDLSSYYGYTYLVYFFNGEHSKTFTTGSGNDIPDSTELQFRVRVTGVGTAFTGQTVPFTVEANEGVTGVVSTGGNADTLDNLDSTKFLRSDVDDTFDANLTITGNLTVQGTQTTLNTATLNVEDKNIVLNYGTGDTSGSADGAGITIQDAVNSSTDATILWNATTDKFDFSHGIDVTGATTLDGYVYVNVAGNNLVLQSDSLQRETIQWTQNNVNRWKLNLQADGDLDFVPADTADKLLYNNNEIATQSWVSSQGYVTSFTETDTLDSVTDRGATTTNNISVGTISSGQITSTGSVTAGNASTSLGFYVGTTQVIQGSTRKLVNVTADANIITSGTLASARLPSTAVQFGSYSQLHSSGDLDDLVGFRLYRVTGGTNMPFSSHHALMQISNSDANKYNVQMAFTTVSSGPEFKFRSAANGTYSSWERLFSDNYHPNADKWTTPRTLTVTLTGDVTGTANTSIDGSANKTITISTTGGGASTDTLDDVTDRGATTTNNITVGTITSGQITSSGSVTAGNASTSLGFYVGTTQVIQGSTRNLVNIGGISATGKVEVRQFQIDRAEPNAAIWFQEGNLDTNHVMWNDYYGGPTTRGAANSGFDGIKWNLLRGLHLRGGSAGAYNCLVITNSSGATNDHTVSLYASNVKRLETTTSGVTVTGTATANGYNIGSTTVIDSSRNLTNITTTYINGTTTFIFNGSGTGTYNKGAMYCSSSEFTFEAPLTSDSATAPHVPIYLTWRGGYGSQGGIKITDGQTEVSGQVSTPKIRLTETNDAGLGSTGHAFQIGPSSGTNIIMDDNEVMARNNGSNSTLHLNADGGNVSFRNNQAGTTNLVMSGVVFMDHSRNLLNINNVTTNKIGVNGGFNALQGVAQFKGDVTMNRGSIIRWANNGGGTGEYIYSKASSPYDVTIHSGGYDALQCPNTGEVRLNHNGSQRLVTSSGGITVNGGTVTVGADGSTGYVASRIRLESHNQYRGAGLYMRCTADGDQWFAGTPYSDFDGYYMIGFNSSITSDVDQTAQLSHYKFRVDPAGNCSVKSSLQVNGTTVIDSLRNFKNANTVAIGSSGVGNYPIYAQGATRYVIGMRNTGVDANYPWLVHDASGSTSRFAIHFNAIGDRWYVDEGGNSVASGNVTAFSDIKLKENIEVIPEALSKIRKIRGVTFTRKDREDTEKRHAGVIAQEVEQVLPEVVEYDGLTDTKTVAYGNLVSLCIQALKEADEKIESLTKRIEELENGNHKDD